jgi:hypothetical protein
MREAQRLALLNRAQCRSHTLHDATRNRPVEFTVNHPSPTEYIGQILDKDFQKNH